MTPRTCARCLTLVGYGFIAFSLVWVTTAFAGIDAPGRLLIDFLDWPLDGKPDNPSSEARWMGAIGAGLTCGIGIMFTHAFAPILRMNDPYSGRIIKRGLIIGMLAWYLVDGAGSIASGVPSNAVFNTIFLALVVIPLARLKYEESI